MKKTRLLMLTIFFCLLPGFTSHAAWFIDSYRFQTSVHGGNSCLDCHENIIDQKLHPNPENVNRTVSESFHPDQCLICHDDIRGELEEGIHGGRAVEDPKKFTDCIGCHDPHYEPLYTGAAVPTELPALSEEDRECMICHVKREPDDPRHAEQIIGLCFHCHGKTGAPAQEVTRKNVPLIDPAAYESTPHAALACTVCHIEAAAYPHSDQQPGECRRCHTPHDAKVAHAVHLNVSCQACHLQGIEPVKDARTGEIAWRIDRQSDAASSLHHMAGSGDPNSCRRCHFSGNEIGAAAMVLPAKSILCMPCHAATFSIGDTTSILAILLFLIGIIAMFSYFLTGSVAESSHADWLQKLSLLVRGGLRSIFSNRFRPIAAALFFDVLLQRRLYRQSPQRWAIHGLIFFPIFIRFLWGFIALLWSLWFPGLPAVWDMLDKNSPVTAFFFDFTGLMLIVGALAVIVRAMMTPPRPTRGLPQPDFIALGLIAGIVIIGFSLEGMRIAMTGRPPGSVYGFIGYAVSRLFSAGPGIGQAYGYLWYAHAILTGAFVAYIPFSRLSHIILAPVTLAMRAADETEQKGA